MNPPYHGCQAAAIPPREAQQRSTLQRMTRIEAPEKATGASENNVHQQMRTARDDLLRKLARLRGQEG
jgi:hypothetical protein